RRDAHAKADIEQAARHGIFRFFLIVDHLLDRAAAAPAPLARPGDAGIAGSRLLGLPGLGALAKFWVRRAVAIIHAIDRVAGRGLVGEKRACASPKLGFFGGVFKVHFSVSARAGRKPIYAEDFMPAGWHR